MAQELGTGTQRAGKNSRVQVNAVNLNQASWNVDYQGGDGDTTNFESGGYEEGIACVLSASWSVDGNWDAGDNPFDDPPGLYVRDDLQDLYFYENVSDAVLWDFPYARVRSAKNGANVTGVVTFGSSGKNQGEFDLPTGSV
jgi:hypothetical protein